ncbi:MAG TPA: hypothetical protein PLU53_00165 [Bacteroidia bacterium]|nr:hypothetical protein [Bacteroidia bacterium]
MKTKFRQINYLLSISFLFILHTHTIAGVSEERSGISMSGYVSEQIEGLPPISKDLLQNKLNQIVTQNGITNGPLGSRFIITPNINVMTKDILPGPPPMHALTLSITFYIGDGIEGRKFASRSITVKGVGTNETKAYNEGIKQINPSDPQLAALLEEGKKKIIEYYTNHCDAVIKNAQSAASLGNYEDALSQLTTIPDACKACYDRGMTAAEPMYKKYIDQQCQIKLTEARAAWNAQQNSEGAAKAGAALASIEPTAACYPEAAALNKEISGRMTELGNKEWEYKMKIVDAATEVAKARIEAYRAISVSYYLSRRSVIVYNIRGWW